MREYGFSVTRILPYKDKIVDFENLYSRIFYAVSVDIAMLLRMYHSEPRPYITKVCLSNQDRYGKKLLTGHSFQSYTAQKMKFSIKNFFSKCDQIRSFLRIWSRLLKIFLMENIFCAVISNVPLAPDTLESIWRLGERICKKAKLYYTALFTCSLDNDVVCKDQEIDYKRIVEISDVED